jgi:hypothetical protein
MQNTGYILKVGGGMLKQGWLGYNLNEKDQIHLGLTQVPFGIQQYNSHWFQLGLLCRTKMTMIWVLNTCTQEKI